MNNTNGIPRKAWILLFILAFLPLIPSVMENLGDETAQKAGAAKPTIPTRVLNCDSDGRKYPWIGYGTSILVVPPSDCWTEWQGIGEDGVHSKDFNLLIDGRGIKRRYRYGDGSVGPVVEPKPFSDRRFGYPTAVQFKNGGKEEVKIKADVR